MFTIAELVCQTRGRLLRPGRAVSVSGISIDSRTISPGEAFIAFRGEHFDGHDFIDAAVRRKAACIIGAHLKNLPSFRRPGGCAFIEVKDPLRALGDIAAGYRSRFTIPLVAVTGSCGKTTTKEMLAWVLARRFSVHKTEGTKNNHIGLPMTLLGLRRHHDVAVVELGTNHFGEIAYLARICRPTVGIITNVGAAHLEHFRTVRGVLREKFALIQNLAHPGLAVINADDPLLNSRARHNRDAALTVTFAQGEPADFRASAVRYEKDRVRFSINGRYRARLRTLGAQNISNALAAVSCCRILGMGYRDILTRLATFEFPGSRLQIKNVRSRRLIDDTYNANPVSLRQALEALRHVKTAGKKILVMGDMLELGSRRKQLHYQIGTEAASVCDKMIAVGKSAAYAVAAARDAGVAQSDLFCCDSSEEARRILFEEVSESTQDVILVKGSRLMQMEKIFE